MRYLFLSCLVLAFNFSYTQIRVSLNQRYLMSTDGKPFFWLGDTAWELFHRLTREEAEEFLELRKQQGFNVIQAVALAEMNGLRQPNRYGDLPLIEEDPTRLATTPGTNPANETEYDYWDHVDFIINRIAYKGMYVGLLPTWGDKVAHMWGDGPIIFNETNAEVYGATLAKRYARHWNIIWILGGDRPATYKVKIDSIEQEFNDKAIWRAMAKGIESVLGKDAFITYHPMGGASSSTYFHTDSWLDMNAFQSGHGARETEVWDWVTHDLALKHQKPTLDMEPCYEDHPVNPWDGKWTRAERGYFTAYDVRARIYRSVFAGACGVTYGHHQIWQFLNTELNPPINIGDTLIGWQKAAKAEAAGQMQYLKKLMLSRPYFARVDDQSLVASYPGINYTDHIVATRHENGLYAFIYLPQNQPISIDLSRLAGTTKAISWFDPRTGKTLSGYSTTATGVVRFTPPKEGMDWVLIIDDASQNFPNP
ncbi:MAG TPA: glycoside hydrolase family 140 protein [Cyclobacteriaceae bacterium]|nr:glycoside hydrolase family 140 protein [Cytophagales bacterium]HRE66986.1 glycoside hydrolase family 140 protein [Cyclobacteriaceae bacterium]HRF33160.1 glycoside hydrolase family 140 protein [Cyclobacteriaceae bacterium]